MNLGKQSKSPQPNPSWRLLLAGLALPVVAAAEPGDHIRAGDAVITPKLSLGFEYSTNVFHAEDATEGGTNLRLAPGLEISAEGPDLEFTFGGEYELRKYFGATLVDAGLDRYNDFQLSADLIARKEQSVGFELHEAAGLRNYPSEIGTDPYNSLLRNQLEGGIAVRPGSALEIRLLGNWTYDQYRGPSGPLNDKNSYGPRLNAAWKFIPRTAIVFESLLDINDWSTQTLPDTGLEVNDSEHLKVLAGLRGRMTPKLVTTLLVGYGVGYYGGRAVGDPSLNVKGLEGLLVDVQFKYEPGKDDKFILGYQKNFKEAWFTDAVMYNHPYLRVDSRFNPRFGFRGEVGTRFESYRGAAFERDDLFLDARGDLSYYMQDWASLTGGVWWTDRASTDAEVDYTDVNAHLFMNIVY